MKPRLWVAGIAAALVILGVAVCSKILTLFIVPALYLGVGAQAYEPDVLADPQSAMWIDEAGFGVFRELAT